MRCPESSPESSPTSLLTELDPGPQRRKSLLAFGALTPLPIVGLSLFAVELEWGLGWGIHFITGSLVVSALVGCGLALAMSAPEREEVIA